MMNNSNIRIGETRIMNNGLKATIISYQNNKNMDVQFENGKIACKIRYEHFVSGGIRCPMIIEYIDDYIKVTNPNLQPNTIFLIDKDDAELVMDTYWCNNGCGYIAKSNGVILHRLIMNPETNEYVDHINHDITDNRKNNLRICNKQENCSNRIRPRTNSSGYKGVVKTNKKWSAQIGAHGKHIYLGCFSNKEDAAVAYNQAAIKYFGEFAKLNNI